MFRRSSVLMPLVFSMGCATTSAVSEDVAVRGVTDDSITVTQLENHQVLFLGECVKPSLLPSGRRCLDNAVAKDQLEPRQLGSATYSTYVDQADVAGGVRGNWFRRMFGTRATRGRSTIQIIHEWKRSTKFSVELPRDLQLTAPVIRELELGYAGLLVLNVDNTNLSIGAEAKVGLADVKAWMDSRKVPVSIECRSHAKRDLCSGITNGPVKTGAELNAIQSRFKENTTALAGSPDTDLIPPNKLEVIGYLIELPAAPGASPPTPEEEKPAAAP